MAESGVIARIYPVAALRDHFRRNRESISPAVERPHRASSSSSRRERESTQELDSGECGRLCIELRFSKLPRSRHGVVFGRSPRSHVVLPDDPHISGYHFTLTFDESRRPIIKDWGSRNGTMVTYDRQGGERRSGFQWIVGGHEYIGHTREITVSVPSDPYYELRIEVPPHDIQSRAYADKVDRFLQGSATAESLFQLLDLQNCAETEGPSGTCSALGVEPIYLRKPLGTGSFSAVDHGWDVSTGAEYAFKRPSPEAARRGRFDLASWKNEAHIMGLIVHPNIVQLLWADFQQSPPRGPVLCLEFAPCGTLADQSSFSGVECTLILQQCLSALDYLHGSDPPIVHRDIKQDNILVQSRDSFGIVVKLSDFGLAKDYANMSTICGNWHHIAPEIYLNVQYKTTGGQGRVSYTEAVDIWSLGVVVYELQCPLPKYREGYDLSGTKWAEKIVHKFEKDLAKGPNDLKRFLLRKMIVIEAEHRWSADACLAQALLLPFGTGDNQESPTPASRQEEDVNSTIRHAESRNSPWPETVLWQPELPNSSSYGTKRQARSDAPSPQSPTSDAGSTPKRQAAASSGPVAQPYESNRKRVPRESKASLSPGRNAKRQHRRNARGASISEQDLVPKSEVLEQQWLYPDTWEPLRQDEGASRYFEMVDEGDENPLVGNFPQEWPPPGGWQEPSENGVDTAYLDFISFPTSYSGTTEAPMAIPGSGLEQIIGPEEALVSQVHQADRTEGVSTAAVEGGKEKSPLKTQEQVSPSHRQSAESGVSEGPGECQRGPALFFDVEGLVYTVLRGNVVSMNASTFYLNASQVLGATQVNRQAWLKKIRKHGASIVEGQYHWLPFRDGVFLCQTLGLEETLRHLLSFPGLPFPDSKDNYWTIGLVPDGYETLWAGDQEVSYQPSSRMINATHLARLNNIEKHRISQYFRGNPAVDRHVVRGKPRVSGTYVSYENALNFCKYFNIDLKPLKHLLAAKGSSASNSLNLT
ncbi:hypothetical protein VTK73DRAFT_8585 [Phialemonium thermophilum]|uniref:Uncharacterized protein n=1 Tax=Phialemonium thermophilum TaxID=223376 RepID=A0ABR3W7J2_9PEZI